MSDFNFYVSTQAAMTIMRQRKLIDEGPKSRRTIADALEVLRQIADFCDGDRAEITIGGLKLATGQTVGLVAVVFDHPTRGTGCVVTLPSCVRFKAIRDNSRQRVEFDISLLDGAVVDAEGIVSLKDSTTLRAVEVIPVPLPENPSKREWRIVKLTVAIAGAEQRCYRNFRDSFPPHEQAMVPNVRLLDCSKLYDLDIPPLKALAFRIAEMDCRAAPSTSLARDSNFESPSCNDEASTWSLCRPLGNARIS